MTKAPWPRDLAEAAEALAEPKKAGRMEDNSETPTVFILEYLDGLRGYSLVLPGHLKGWAYAAASTARWRPQA